MTTVQTAVHHRWSDIRPEAIGNLIVRRYITGDRMTVAEFHMKRGAKALRHGHDSEEMCCVLKGAVKYEIEGNETVVRQGEVFQVPGGMPHQVEALEDADLLFAFSPIRQDWIEKADNYYER